MYRDHEGDILEADFEGIRWLRENVPGSPVVLEGHTPTYWGSRISVYTGLPTVVGWKWHQEQQRWDYRHQVGLRIEDVDRLYSTAGRQEALSLLRKYEVRYIYVGHRSNVSTILRAAWTSSSGWSAPDWTGYSRPIRCRSTASRTGT